MRIFKEIVFGVICLSLVCGFFHFIGICNMVIGESMAPTLESGQFVVSVSAYLETPEVDDIVVLKQDGKHLIKRVYAGPGQTVVETRLDGKKQILLAENQYYVLGDNYENSRDSRSFGPVDAKDIRYVVKNTNKWVALVFVILMAAFIIAVVITVERIMFPKNKENNETNENMEV